MERGEIGAFITSVLWVLGTRPFGGYYEWAKEAPN
jgi:uncharacterized BrkB/YihY/UPF0761 family membrane protein